jgi:hypothetical protein
MFSKVFSKSTISLLGIAIALSLCIGLPGAIADECDPDLEPCPCNPDVDLTCIYGCTDDAEFTTEFLLDTCKFKSKGINPYFILQPGYQLVLETPEDADEREKSVETVLRDKKTIRYNGRKIKTRVLEERAFEWDDDEEEWVTIEISLNWFAICKRTNAVYYFGEWSRDCEDGFDENDVCEGEESNDGSWEAGVDGAEPGLIMPGTPLKGAKYFQERAEESDAVDRGEIADVGLDVTVPAGDFSGCIEIYDTNPSEADEGGCIGENDVKLYCRGVGLVKDQELELVSYGFGDYDDDDDDDNDDDDD